MVRAGAARRRRGGGGSGGNGGGSGGGERVDVHRMGAGKGRGGFERPIRIAPPDNKTKWNTKQCFHN